MTEYINYKKEKNYFNNIFKNSNDKSYNIAEIGINHNGDLELAKELIKISYNIGFDCVKFQKRVPELCVPQDKRNEIRITPWGEMTYFQYKKKIEFSKSDYDEIDIYCKELGVDWSASAWDIESLKFLNQYDIPFIKVPSDKCTDINFIKALKEVKIPLIISTGGTDFNQIEKIFDILDDNKIILLQCTSIYPCPTEKINLKVINALKDKYKLPVGFSSHHTSPLIPAMSVAYGAKVTEVHVTLDRAMWGTDQAMSLEPRGMQVMISAIKNFELALGVDSKEILEDEKSTLKRTVGR
ncbi:MAG: N-acetylneuraminate synthase [Candidatus Marinimicrobia bacterium]|nr:N-acetylneuraminate synthase [Candidatus Neomarinimicrobiota bacterium]|tara:strand:- start:9643 stop:10533 length:891 start_codon:yes stop_codon:yes gene_type:complete